MDRRIYTALAAGALMLSLYGWYGTDAGQPVPQPARCVWGADPAEARPGSPELGPVEARFTIEYHGEPAGFRDGEIRAHIEELLGADGRYIPASYDMVHSGGGTYVVTVHSMWRDEVDGMKSMLFGMPGITGVSHVSESRPGPSRNPAGLGHTLFVMEYDGVLHAGEIRGILEDMLGADGRYMQLDYQTLSPEVLRRDHHSQDTFRVKDTCVMMVSGMWKDEPREHVPFDADHSGFRPPSLPWQGGSGGLLVWKDGPVEAALKDMPGMVDVSLVEPYFGWEPSGDRYERYGGALFAMEYSGDPGGFPSGEILEAVGGHDLSGEHWGITGRYNLGEFSNLWIAHPGRDGGHSGGAHILVMDHASEDQIGKVQATLEEIPGMTWVASAAVPYSDPFPEGWNRHYELMRRGIFIDYGGDLDNLPMLEIMRNADAVLERKGESDHWVYHMNNCYVGMCHLHMTGEYTYDELREITGVRGVEGWDHVTTDWIWAQ